MGQLKPVQSQIRINGPKPNSQSVSPKLVLNTMRQWWLVATPVGLLLAAGACFLAFYLYKPEYRATATLKIEKPSQLIFKTDTDNKQFVNDQIAFLTNEIVLEPALDEIQNKGGLVDKIPELKKARDRLAELSANLTVTSVGKSNFYEVSYTSSDPEASAGIVNEITASFLRLRTDREDERRKRLKDILEGLQGEQKTNISGLKERLVSLHARLIQSDNSIPSLEALGMGKPTALAQLDSQRATADYRVKLLTRQLEDMRAENTAAPQISAKELSLAIDADPRVLELLAQIDDLKGKIAIYERNGKNVQSHTAYQDLKSSVEKHKESVAELRSGLQEEYQAALFREQALARNEQQRQTAIELKLAVLANEVITEQYHKELESSVSTGSQSLVDLGFAQAELAKSEGVLSLIDDQLLKIALEHFLQPTELARKARVPHIPTGKGPWFVMTAAGLVGFFIPFGLALIWEVRTQRVSDSSTIQETARLPIIGEIATLPTRRQGGAAKNGNPGLWLFEESVDSMRTNLTLSEELKDAQVMAVTSACSREGKTSISAQLAVSIARATGHRTLIVDGDMRSPDLHVIFDAEDGKGLADVLSGKCSLDEAIVATPSPNLDLLPAGHLRSSPHKLVSNAFSNGMLTELKKRYRYVIIDTPPILSASEALVMAKAADVSLVCAMRDVSRIDQVERAYSRLMNVDAKPAGIVLNGVPARAYAYSYGKYDYARS